MTELSLVVFDVDGTLIDSQAHIAAALEAMYRDGGRQAPDRTVLLSIVGLSLTQAIQRLEPDLSDAAVADWAAAYRAHFVDLRRTDAPSPMYPGAKACLDRLMAVDPLLLGVATGKARRGLDHLIAAHDLSRYFVTLQTSDLHPSKPHPAMLEAALAEAGVPASRAVMIGDTTFDMDMGAAAGVATVAVTWGYHSEERLRGTAANAVAHSFDEVAPAVGALLGHAL
ncbi:MAG: HAD-IA family hydrolase [Pseudomonadota bacterium]